MKTILLVEDDPFIVDIYSIQFKREGFKVDIAKDAEMALAKLKNTSPDLLVLDLKLPGMDGWELLKIIRADERMKNLKVIIISNFNEQENAYNVAKLGVLKYFLKVTTTPEELINSVKEILK